MPVPGFRVVPAHGTMPSVPDRARAVLFRVVPVPAHRPGPSGQLYLPGSRDVGVNGGEEMETRRRERNQELDGGVNDYSYGMLFHGDGSLFAKMVFYEVTIFQWYLYFQILDYRTYIHVTLDFIHKNQFDILNVYSIEQTHT
jgi:hypothetical protein